MASLWIGSGEGLAITGLGIEDLDYEVGASFEALDEGVLAAASKSTGYFFTISISQKVQCGARNLSGVTKFSQNHPTQLRLARN